MIATFRINDNAGFLIYIAHAFGYLGSVAVSEIEANDINVKGWWEE